jgi:myosin-crossreactive antigen
MKKLNKNDTYEDNINYIKISKITNENYEILNKKLNKYNNELNEELEKLINSEEESLSDEWINECCDVKFYNAIYDSDFNAKTIFSKKDCKIIQKIIEKSILLD